MAACQFTEEFFTANDGVNIFVRRWEPTNVEPKSFIHIHHGLAEHGMRYAEFAERAVQEGYIVVAHDARGHGNSAGVKGSPGLGCIAGGPEGLPEGAVPRMAQDFTELLIASQSSRPSLPILLLGHSFGTVIARMTACSFRIGNLKVPPLAGVLLSAPPSRLLDVTALAFKGLLAALHFKYGEHGTSKIPAMLTFDQFQAKTIKESKPTGLPTGWEWLNRDPAEVKKYQEDELCGQDMSIGFWSSAIKSLLALKSAKTYAQMASDLPICIFMGDSDFCCVDDLGVSACQSIQGELKAAGKTHPKVVIYGNARHEIMLELNKDEVHHDMLDYCHRCISTAAARSRL